MKAYPVESRVPICDILLVFFDGQDLLVFTSSSGEFLVLLPHCITIMLVDDTTIIIVWSLLNTGFSLLKVINKPSDVHMILLLRIAYLYKQDMKALKLILHIKTHMGIFYTSVYYVLIRISVAFSIYVLVTCFFPYAALKYIFHARSGFPARIHTTQVLGG